METRLVKVLVEVMGDVFPELRQHEVHIRDIIAEEEASFGKTLLNVSLSSVQTVLGFKFDVICGSGRWVISTIPICATCDVR